MMQMMVVVGSGSSGNDSGGKTKNGKKENDGNAHIFRFDFQNVIRMLQ